MFLIGFAVSTACMDILTTEYKSSMNTTASCSFLAPFTKSFNKSTDWSEYLGFANNETASNFKTVRLWKKTVAASFLMRDTNPSTMAD
jgi:hypothetical protein